MLLSRKFQAALALSLAALALTGCGDSPQVRTSGAQSQTAEQKSSGDISSYYNREKDQTIIVYKKTDTVQLGYGSYANDYEGVIVNFAENQFCTYTTLSTGTARANNIICKDFDKVASPANKELISELAGYREVTPVVPAKKM